MENNIEWTVYPYKQDKKKTIFAIILFILILVFIYLAIGGIFWTLFALLILGGANISYVLPVTYKLSDEQVTVKKFGSSSDYDWDYFKRCVEFDDGIGLCPFENPSRLDNFRSVLIRYGDQDKEVIKQFITNKIRGNKEE